jgi:hypothetical protein
MRARPTRAGDDFRGGEHTRVRRRGRLSILVLATVCAGVACGTISPCVPPW